MENWVLVALLASAILAIAGMGSIGFSLGHGSTINHDEEEQPLVEKKPNIVFIMLDDLGFNDISWNNPSVHTPNMENLARSGVILNRNYAHSVCSPSRGELLTGKYAHRLGLQHYGVIMNRPQYIPLGEKLLSERLQDLGYSTHLLGKWHVGHCRLDYVPTRRGFDTFYGTLNAYIDSYTKCTTLDSKDIAYDWYDQEAVDFSHQDIHATDLLRNRALSIMQQQNDRPFFMFLSFFAPHLPVQVPRKYLEAYQEVKDEWRKGYLGMISHVDEAVGQVVAMLKTKGLFNNTMIAMTSDNGGFVGPASNFPLRGSKRSTYEGGHRVPGFISGPQSIIKKYGYISNERFHITDWLPTLVSMAHGKIDAETEDLDGIDQSSTLTMGLKSKRREMVYHIDTLPATAYPSGYAAISYDNYKLVVGPVGRGDGWEQDGNAGWWISQNVSAITSKYGTKVDVEDHICSGSFAFPLNRTIARSTNKFVATIPLDRHQLFNIKADPEERNDLSAEMPLKVKELKELLQKQIEKEVSPPEQVTYPKSKTQRDGAWVTGWC